MKAVNMKKIIRQKGTSTVEFVMLLPFLLMLLFLIISFGFMLYDQAIITNAARTGVRAGIVFSVSGNGLDSSCNTLTNNNIYGATTDVILAGAKSTAECSANIAINNPARLIVFGTSSTPTIVATTPTSCITISPSCLLTTTITYDYTAINFLNLYFISSVISPTLRASSSMYYE
jgi:Flp pilus assembly protein TadG